MTARTLPACPNCGERIASRIVSPANHDRAAVEQQGCTNCGHQHRVILAVPERRDRGARRPVAFPELVR